MFSKNHVLPGKKGPSQSLYVNAHYHIQRYDLYRYFGSRRVSKEILALLGVVALGGACSLAQAEVRVYQPGATSGTATVPRGNTSAITPPAPVQASGVADKPAVVTTDPSNSAYVAAMQLMTPPTFKWGSARIFIRPEDLSAEMVERLQAIAALKDLHSEIYFQDVKPEELVRLFREKLKDYPQGLQFNIDLNGTLASELQVKGKNVMVYTSPKGQVSQFELNSTYSYQTAIERIKEGAAAQ